MSMRTPFSRVTGLGSAKDGTTHFWRQRLTAIANVPLTLFLVWFAITIANADVAGSLALVANPFVAALLILSAISIAWHMKIGMQVVIEDYVHGELRKIVLIMLNTFFVFFSGALVAFAVFKLAFGS